MTYYTGRWAGRVYDGPLEGEQRIEERPYFEMQWSPRLMPRPWSPDVIPDMVYIYRLLYRWSNPLRCWVFDWRSAIGAVRPQTDRVRSQSARMKRDAMLFQSEPKFRC